MVRRTEILSEEEVWKVLETVQDPEIPVLSLVDMKIIRKVSMSDDTITITISPTFVGCPALDHMKGEIRTKLHEVGFAHVDIETTLSPR